MERRIKKNDDWQFELFSKSGDYLEMIISLEGQILYINSILPGFYMYNVLGSSVFDFLSNDSAKITRVSINEALTTNKKILYETNVSYNKEKNLCFHYLNRIKKETFKDGSIVLHLIAIDLTMHKIIQNELLVMNDEFILNNLAKLGDGLIFRVITPDFKIRYANEHYQRFFIPDKKNHNFNLKEILSSEDFPQFKDHIDRILTTKQPDAIETKERNTTGVYLNCNWSNFPEFDENRKVKEIHSYGILQNFNSKSEKSLKLQAYQKLLEGSPVSFWEEDASELKKYLDSWNPSDLEMALEKHPKKILKCASLIKIKRVNTKTLFLFKVKNLEEINQKSIIFFFNKESIETFKKRLISLAYGKTYFEAPCSSIDAEGNIIDHMLKVIVPEGYEKSLSRILVFMIKDPERNKLRREIEKQYNQLIRSDRLKSLGIMIAGAAHEINNPNHVIMLNSSIIKQIVNNIFNFINENNIDVPVMGMPLNKLKNNLSELMNGIEESSGKIKYIVNELRNYTVRGSDSNHKEIIDINKILKNSIRLSRGFIKKCTDDLTIVYSDESILVFADKIRIEQVFINIIENACQALENKSQRIKISVEKKDNSFVEVSIIDEGAGISAEELNLLMTPFYTTKRDKAGTGLGLFISHNILENHNGKIRFVSELSKGTTVKISLPIYLNQGKDV